tara:strand:+ start:1370 stop:2458 length:1089 start_codon:yes stop_codon:yes gene_type:complete
MASSIVRTPSNSIIGVLREATGGTPAVASATDTGAYNRLNVAEASPPVYNIIRESRLTSGAGSIKNLDDTFTSNAGGTAEIEFEMPVTDELLPHFLASVTQSGTGTTDYAFVVNNANRNSVPLGVAHTTIADPYLFTLAYLENQNELTGTGLKLSACVVRELTLSWQAGSNGNNMMMSGVITSGVTVGQAGTSNRAVTFSPNSWVDPTLAYYNGSELATKTLDIGASDDQDLVINSFSFTINNNAQRYGGDERGDAEGYMLPAYDVTGNVSVKSDGNSTFVNSGMLDDFIAGEKSSLNLRWGSSFIGAGDLQITGECQFSGQPDLQLDDAIFVNLPMEFGMGDGLTDAFKVELYGSRALADW